MKLFLLSLILAAGSTWSCQISVKNVGEVINKGIEFLPQTKIF